MRVIVFSDSHGRLDNAFKALKEAGRLDYLLHAGDLYQDAFAWLLRHHCRKSGAGQL